MVRRSLLFAVLILGISSSSAGQIIGEVEKELPNDGSYDKQIGIARTALELIKSKKYKKLKKLYGPNVKSGYTNMPGINDLMDVCTQLLNKYGMPKTDSVKIMLSKMTFVSGTATSINIIFTIGYDEPERARIITVGFQIENGDTNISFISPNF